VSFGTIDQQKGRLEFCAAAVGLDYVVRTVRRCVVLLKSNIVVCNVFDTSYKIMAALRSRADIIFMAALWNRIGHYIFALWFLSSFFFFPRLISAVAE